MQSLLSTAWSYLITGLAAIFVFGLVIFIHELGHFLTAKACGITVNEFAIGMGPVLLKKKRKGTQYALRLFPIGGFVSMEGEDEDSDAPGSFNKAPVGSRILVILAGAFMNILLGFFLLLGIVCSDKVITSRTVSSFYEGATTQASGLAVGDTILSVNGRRCFIANDIIYEFARTQDGSPDLLVLRDGKKVLLNDVQFQTEPSSAGDTQMMVIDFTVLPIQKTVANVMKESTAWTMSYARLVLLSIIDLVTGRIPVNDLSGPVGIVSSIGETVGQVSSIGLKPFVMLMALLTVNLGVFNVMPIPALDGGKFVLLLVEAVRRKPIAQKYEIVINALGFVMLIGLMLFATFNDITRLVK